MTTGTLTISTVVLLLGEIVLGVHDSGITNPAGESPPAAIIQDEQTSTALYNTALHTLKKKDYKAAEMMLRQVLALNSRYQEPSGRSAWHQLGFALERQDKKLEALRTLEQGRDSLQSAAQKDWHLTYDLARLYAETGSRGHETEITELVYQTFKNSTPAQQPDLWQRLFDEVGFLLDKAEREQMQRSLSAPDGQPGLLLLQFFRREDPYPTTPANEGLLLFFQRAVEAKARFPFALSPRGYDERGDLYVRLGQPWRIHTDHSGVMGDQRSGLGAKGGILGYAGWAIYPHEVWFYTTLHPDLYFTFIRKEGRIQYTLAEGPESILGTFYHGRGAFGNRQNVGETAISLRDEIYRNLAPSHATFRRRLYELGNILTAAETSTRSRRIDYAEAAAYSVLHFTNDDRKHAAKLDTIAPAVVFDEDYKLKSLPIDLSFSRFHDESGDTRTEIYYGSLYRDLKFEHLAGEYRARLRGEIAILDENYEIVTSDSIREDCVAFSESAKDSGDFVNQTNFLLKPARYHLFFRLENPAGEQVGVLRSDLEVTAFPKTSLSISDLQLSPNIYETKASHRFVKHGYYVEPLPGLTIHKDKSLFVYFEIYHLTRDDLGETRYRIDYRVYVPERKKGLLSKFTGLFGGRDRRKHTVTLSATRAGRSPNEVEHVELDLGKFSSNDLELEIIVTDMNAKQQVSTKLPFKLLK